MKRFHEFLRFTWKCLGYLAHEKAMFIGFMLVSIAVALTEGVGISMLVPILESQSGSSVFANVPLLKYMSAYFESIEPGQRMQVVAVALSVILLVRGALQFYVQVLGSMMPLRLKYLLTLRGYNALMDVEYGYIADNDVGNLQNGLTVWVDGVSVLLTNVAQVIWNIAVLLVYVVLLLALSWKLTVVSVAFFGVLSYVLKLFSTGPLRRAGEELSNQNASKNESIFETLTGMRLVRMSAAERFMERAFDGNMKRLVGTETTVIKYNALTNPFLMSSAGLFICVLLFGGSVLEGAGGEWLSSLLMFLFLLMRLLAPVSNINVARYRIIGHLYFMEMIEKFHLEAEHKAQSSGELEFTGIGDGVHFKNVDFAYPNADRTALKGLDLDIPEGKMTAIVGPSGAGKTTLISLLTRFYDPQGGDILINGKSIADYDIYSLRRHLSVVSQDIFIFNDTVSRNIAFSLGEVSDEEIHRAAKLAAADDFIRSLPEGYDTKLGDRGVKLSGGQQQRIAIARAILRNPDLLILDEATSHLDTYTEKAIQDAVEELRHNRTMLVIAHRLSTVRKADKVIVLKDGQVAEEGALEDLMAKKGAFWDMVTHQNLDLVDEDETVEVEHVN